MKALLRFASVLAGLAVLAPAQPAYAFINELAQLKQELHLYDTTHAAEFGDVVGKLDGMAGPSFEDVTERDWFHPYVMSMANWGIVSGYRDPKGEPTGKFGPGDTLTVAAALKMSLKSAQIDETQCPATPRHARAKTHWAAVYVACAEAKRMRLFSSKTPVDLDRPVTRAEAVAMIHDAFDDTLLPLFSPFKDTAGHPYEADIATASARGYVTGDKDREGRSLGTFRPNGKLNRAEASTLLYNRLKVQVKEEIALAETEG